MRLKPPGAVLVAWPPTLDFGALIVGQDAVHSLILSHEGNLPVHLRQQENPLVQVLGADVVHLEPGESREFQVTIDNFVAGQTADALVWRDVDSGAALLQMPVAVKGLAPVLHTGANELDFGLVEVGVRSKRTLRLRNEGDAALQVRQLEVEAPFAVALDGQRVLKKPGAEAVPAHSQVSLPFTGRGVSALLQLEATAHVFAATSLDEETVWTCWSAPPWRNCNWSWWGISTAMVGWR